MKLGLSILSTIFFCSSVFPLFAQNKTDEQKRQELENFRAKRVAYITKEVSLTDEEAKGFWPICNEMEEKKFELNRNIRQGIKKIRDEEKAGKNVSDAEYDRLINLIQDSKVKEAELEKEYIKKIRKIIPAEKVLKYQRAEHKFAREAFSPSERR